ncbi:energy-coupling factor ABC transporter ATP-binding protein [Humibacillus xanthopallidus]|uniref:Biotin transport system ATP-binding protein n=1 Tax=Humibacillus xanthopallidus TaxID=412689 RepID=A0A543HVC9_9MICO|nr:ABC transporter ATP-binding protein [Humibacillus xanthopallidus]TQM62315.1 biotin transport system ATP-binding protein [Humibacillus xanthopallidus]
MPAEPHTAGTGVPDRPEVVITAATVSVPLETGTGRRTLLGPLDLVLREPRVTVVGANGSGKSTLLRLLNGLVLPTSGSVRVDGLDTARHGSDVRRRVAFAFTDPISQLVMPTGREDVELSLRRVHRSRSERRAAAETVLARFGLTELADRSVYELSGGERQLMALAVVLATEPRLLVLDEPTTLLDLRNTVALRRLVATLPQSVVTATHDLDLALEADRTLVVEGGRVVFDGSPGAAVEHYRRSVATS